MARHSEDDREIIYIERDDPESSTLKPLLLGLALGLGVGLLFAPRSGEETRRLLQKKLRRMRATTGARLGDLSARIQDGVDALRTGEWPAEEEDEEEIESEETAESRPTSSAREELERRLAAARARRRSAAADEEPVA